MADGVKFVYCSEQVVRHCVSVQDRFTNSIQNVS